MGYTTLWEVPDELWEMISLILPPEKKAGSPGRPALSNRQVFNGILFVLRTGCQWKGLKKEWFGASSSLHTRFQAWSEAGLLKKCFRRMVKYYHQRRRIQWRWQSLDSQAVAAPLGGGATGPNPTDRGKYGSKRHILVDARGAPLSVIVTAANAHDITCALDLVNHTIVPRPKTTYCVHHLCADKGYDSEAFRRKLCKRNFKPHIRKRQYGSKSVPPSLEPHRYPARRWVVERTLSRQNNFRSLRVRWAKKPINWLALIYLACTFVLWSMISNV
jgi:transposase